MKNKYFSNIITFLLFTLILFKVSSFHVYTHHDTDDENCEVCELAIENQNDDFLVPTPILVVTPIHFNNTYEPIISYNLVTSSSLLPSNLFGRPPPQLG